MFTELAPRLFFISGESYGRVPNSNGLLIDSKFKVLVDTGFGISRAEAIKRRCEVDVIINTHFHLDHTYGNRYFPKAEVWAHRQDAMAISSKEGYMAYTGLGSVMQAFNERSFPGGMQPRQVGRELSDGDILDFQDITLEVVHVPGHTPGHIALFEPSMRILFSGDIDLTSFGPWYGNQSSDIEEFTASIEKLISLSPKVIVSSHAGILTDNIEQKLLEYADRFVTRDQFILKQLKQGKTMQELVDAKIIYGKHPDPQWIYRCFEQVMLEKHLQRLIRQGKVILKPNNRFKACV